MIITSIPNGLRVPGAYNEIVFKSLTDGLVALPQRVVIVAEKTSAGSATVETPVRVDSDSDADTKFGKGSLAAVLCRMARVQARYQRSEPEIYCCPVAEPVGAKATKTLTVTAASQQAGNIEIIVGRHRVIVGVTTADTANTIAAAIKSELDKLVEVAPFTATVATNVVTCTFTTNGVNGNDMSYVVVSTPSGVSVAVATGVAGSGAATIATALGALYDRLYDAVVLANHTTVDAAALLSDANVAWAPGTENYRWYFLGEKGSIGTAQTLQAALNDYRALVISCEGSYALPGELAVAAAVAAFGKEKPNASLNGEELDLPAPPAALAYTGGQTGELETLLANGITPLKPSTRGRTEIVRLVTSVVTVGGVPHEGTRDLAYSRTAAALARQVTIGYGGFKQENMSAAFLQDVRDMIVAKHRAAETAGWIREVDSFLEEIKVEESTTLGRTMSSAPFKVAGPVHQLYGRHIMYY